ncbi:carboxylesterase 1-like [Henckelia pumila]|uniref:carboxylesterase 1-like n=1 Tax=Henckelia pumila TaxID=405737 RepID=UPI003C6E0D10
MANMPPIDPNVDPYGYLGIVKNSDDSITRVTEVLPSSPACSDPKLPIISKDIPINPARNTWARLYLPKQYFDSNPKVKLPLLVYYHGGGFVIGSAANSIMHDFCSDLACYIPAIVVSVEYRLAPEHRLPAAYEDGLEALHWIRAAKVEWLTEFADFSRCFLMGGSAGGNLAYHVGLRAASCGGDLSPLKIQGLVLQQPYFGGVKRTESEARLAKDQIFPCAVNDIMWEMALPLGVDRDHKYSNPRVDVEAEAFLKMKGQDWRVLVTGCEGDPLIDRQKDLVRLLEEYGVQVVGRFDEGGCHGIDLFDKSRSKIVSHFLADFIGFPV